MKIIIAPDSFKGSLTAEQAAHAMKRGIERAFANSVANTAAPVSASASVNAASNEGKDSAATLGAAANASTGVDSNATVAAPAAALANDHRSSDAHGKPPYDLELIPLSDGGEGFVQAIVTAQKGTIVSVDTIDPLSRPIKASYGLIDNGKTAIVEMASASGHTLVGDEKKPYQASTYGTGLLICDALDRGCEQIVVGLGGSATNDGGIGMAQALGYKMTNRSGQPLDLQTRGLETVGRIDSSSVHPRLREVTFTAACDVEATLYGPQGATAIFGPQKGVQPDQIKPLDAILESLAYAIQRDLHVDVHELKGGGAAGGIGAGLAAFCQASLRSGTELMLEFTRFHERLKNSDVKLVLTGEGQTDRQTALGKLPVGLGKAAMAQGIPVFCISGSLGEGWEEVKKFGITACFSVMPRPASLQQALSQAESWLEQTVCEVITAWTSLDR